ncbi:MAG: hypothetical protein ACOZQL_07825 [Myxococcota bacterium]
MNAIKQAIESISPMFKGVVSQKIQEAQRGVDAVLRDGSLFSTPKTTLARAKDWLGKAETILKLGEWFVPQAARDEVADFIELHAPALLTEFVTKLKDTVARLETTPGRLKYLPYFLRLEREVPFATAEIFERVLARAFGEDELICNVLRRISPPQLGDDVLPEQRTHAKLSWLAGVTSAVYYPFAVHTLVLAESIRSKRKLHTQKEGSALHQFNQSVCDVTERLPDDVSFLRNAVAHETFVVEADGSATLRDLDKPARTLSEAELAELGYRVLATPLSIVSALGLVFVWRVGIELEDSNIVEVLSAAVRGTPEVELVGVKSSDATLRERLVAIGLPPSKEDEGERASSLGRPSSQLRAAASSSSGVGA